MCTLKSEGRITVGQGSLQNDHKEDLYAPFSPSVPVIVVVQDFGPSTVGTLLGVIFDHRTYRRYFDKKQTNKQKICQSATAGSHLTSPR